MATKHICDRCGKDIHGFSTTFNQIKFEYLGYEHKPESYYGPKKCEKDLCDNCVKDLIKFLEEPVVVK